MNFRVCNLSLIDVMEILLSRSKQYGNENKTNGQWMKKTILFFLLIFLFTRVRDKDCVKNRVKRAKIVRFTLC